MPELGELRTPELHKPLFGLGALLIVAGVGAGFGDFGAGLVSLFVLPGAGLCGLAALEPRLEGEQKITLSGVTFRFGAIKSAAREAEKELAKPADLTELDDLL